MASPSLRAWIPTLAALTVLVGGTGGASSAQTGRGSELQLAAAGFDQLFLHDSCTGDYPPQPDTCLHKQLVEKPFTFGGTPSGVTVR